MTIKEMLKKKAFRSYVGIGVGFVVFYIGMAVHDETKSNWNVISTIGISFSFVAFFYLMVGLKCPKCHKRIGQEYNKNTNYCPKCGASLNENL